MWFSFVDCNWSVWLLPSFVEINEKQQHESKKYSEHNSNDDGKDKACQQTEKFIQSSEIHRRSNAECQILYGLWKVTWRKAINLLFICWIRWIWSMNFPNKDGKCLKALTFEHKIIRLRWSGDYTISGSSKGRSLCWLCDLLNASNARNIELEPTDWNGFLRQRNSPLDWQLPCNWTQQRQASIRCRHWELFQGYLGSLEPECCTFRWKKLEYSTSRAQQ